MGYRATGFHYDLRLTTRRLAVSLPTRRLLPPAPPMPHPAALSGLGHSTSERPQRDAAEAADGRRAPRVPPDGDSPRGRSAAISAPSDRGAPRPADPARRRSRAAQARSPGRDAARRARSPWRTAGDLPSSGSSRRTREALGEAGQVEVAMESLGRKPSLLQPSLQGAPGGSGVGQWLSPADGPGACPTIINRCPACP